MRVEITEANEALSFIFTDPSQLVTLDANFFIPPDRTNLGAKYCFSLEDFKKIWIEPIIIHFPNIAIHEAVYSEFIEKGLKTYVETLIHQEPQRLLLLKDCHLSTQEMLIRDAKEVKIAANTAFDPSLDNKDDRGEVKTLAHISTKGFIYFVSNDNNALRLVDKAEQLGTTLDDLRTIKFYEVIYYLYNLKLSETVGLKALYKYLYYNTKKEKSCNPNWGDFLLHMDKLYGNYLIN